MSFSNLGENSKSISVAICLLISIAFHAIGLYAFKSNPVDLKYQAKNSPERKKSRFNVEIVRNYSLAKPELTHPNMVDHDENKSFAGSGIKEAVTASKPAELLGDIDQDILLPNTSAIPHQIILHLVINRFGKVSSINTTNSDDIPPEITDQIMSRFRAAHYQPGEINGIAVDSEMTIAVGMHTLGENSSPASSGSKN